MTENVRSKDLDDDVLLRLAPSEAIDVPANLQRFLEAAGGDRATVVRLIHDGLHESKWNIARAGIGRVLRSLGRYPVVLAPETAHYSIEKACDVLGYGRQALVKVPVDARFRMDVAALEDAIGSLKRNEYVAAVVAVVGTTEEGAVDPLHDIKFLRDALAGRTPDRGAAASPGQSFWIHADAAWGGYIASLFRGVDVPPDTDDSQRGRLDRLARRYATAMDVSEIVTLDPPVPHATSRLSWEDPDVIKAFLALKDADSITADPHKLGYVPYPAGFIAFRNGAVRDRLVQKANYIARKREGFLDHDTADVTVIGQFTIEGSKPGAAAASCWLAHKTIGLNAAEHGRIIRGTLLAARRLARYLDHHQHRYRRLEQEFGAAQGRREPFSFSRIFDPDTNVVCFLARPKGLKGQKLTDVDCPLERLNALNSRLFDRLGRPQATSAGRLPYAHEFFVSSTTIEAEQYSLRSVERLLRRLAITDDEYRRLGLVVLRCAVMNPHYSDALIETDMDYIDEFVRVLHRETRSVLNTL